MQFHNQQQRRSQIATNHDKPATEWDAELILHYDFTAEPTQPSGTTDIVVDVSGNGWNATFSNDLNTISGGLYYCAAYAGGGVEINLPSNITNAAGDNWFNLSPTGVNNVDAWPVTISFWSRRTSANVRCRHSWFNQASTPWEAYTENNGSYYVRCWNTGSNGWNIISNAYTINQWHHYVFSWDHANSRLQLYIDGVNRLDTNWTPNNSYYWRPSLLNLFGYRFHENSTKAVGGFVDDFKVYNGVIDDRSAGLLWNERPDLQGLVGANP